MSNKEQVLSHVTSGQAKQPVDEGTDELPGPQAEQVTAAD